MEYLKVGRREICPSIIKGNFYNAIVVLVWIFLLEVKRFQYLAKLVSFSLRLVIKFYKFYSVCRVNVNVKFFPA